MRVFIIDYELNMEINLIIRFIFKNDEHFGQ